MGEMKENKICFQRQNTDHHCFLQMKTTHPDR